jgi:hypothetical protein
MTTRTTRPPIVLALGLAAMVLAAGCDGGSATAVATRAGATPLTSPVSRRVVERERALGKSALLRQSDFPAEYVAESDEPQNISDRATHLLAKAVAACPQLHATVLAHRNPGTVSQEVGEEAEPPHPKGFVNIESTITVLPGPSAARKWFALVAQPEMASCLGKAARAEDLGQSPGLSPPNGSIGSAAVSKLALPHYGDQIAACRLEYRLVAEHRALTVNLDYVLVRVGRADALLTFSRVYAPVWASMEQRLTALTVRRLRTALRR